MSQYHYTKVQTTQVMMHKYCIPYLLKNSWYSPKCETVLKTSWVIHLKEWEFCSI